MKSFKLVALVVALMLAMIPLAACGTPAPRAVPPVAPTGTPAADTDIAVKPVAFRPADSLEPVVGRALSGFSLDLFRRLASADEGKSVFLSPLSVWLALCMTYNGASGATAEGMAEALHAAGISVEDLNQSNAGLMGVLTAADPAVKIALANSVWIRKEAEQEIRKDFLDRDRQYYAAQIQALDFGDPSAAGVINRWVEDSTNGNIRELVEPPIDVNSVMFLINAIHFKAPWKVSFDPKKTSDGTFTLPGGQQVQAKFMHRKDGNLGYSDEDVTAARIPYASGRLEMVLIMPQRLSLAGFVKELTPEALQAVVAGCRETPMPLVFPKFRLEYSASLNDALKAMGMGEAFGASSDFSNMSESMGKDLYISELKHKSFIEVNEEGTEASAATSVEIQVRGLMTALEFNKPFVYLIRDSKTGAILFIGTMENPV